MSTCLETLRELKTAIDARMTGKQVQSVGHKGRNLAYSEMNVSDMIAYYRQLWRQCPEAQEELPELQPLDAPTGTRGRPAMGFGSGRV
jgi:hypothetical protein